MRQGTSQRVHMKLRKNRRRVAALLAMLGISGAAPLVHAATYTWNGLTTGGATGVSNNWDTTTANWTGAGTIWPSVTTSNDDALFAGTAGTVTLTTGITVNDIQFSTTGYTITGNTLTLNGTTPTITTDPGVTATMSSVLAGTVGLVKAGTGTLTLSATNNTYTGGTTVSAGTLKLGGGNNGTGTIRGVLTINSGASVVLIGHDIFGYSAAATGVSAININGGTLDITNVGNETLTGVAVNLTGATWSASVAGAYFQPFSNGFGNTTINSLASSTTSIISTRLDLRQANLNTTFTVASGTTPSGIDLLVSGVITQNIAGSGITKAGTGLMQMTGANTYAGSTIVTGGTLQLNFAGTGAPATNILSTSSPLVLGGGTLSLIGKASTTNSQGFASTTLNAGASAISLTANVTANPLVLTLGTITHNAGGTVNFTLPTGVQSATNGITTSTVNTNGIIGPWATVGNDWATNSTNAVGGNIIAYTGYTDIAALGSTLTNGSTTNVRINTAGSGGNIVLSASPATINTLLQNTTTAATVATASQSLLTNGIMIASGMQSLTIGAAAGDGTLTATTAGGELVLNNQSANTLTINSVIANNTSAAPLTKLGSGAVTLNAVNTFSGVLTIGGGTLTIGAAGSLGSGTYAAAITNNGTLTFNSTAAQTLTGVISGSGSLSKTGSGTLSLTTSANTYTGGTTISNGTVQIGINGNEVATALGTGTVNLSGGAILWMQPGSSAVTFNFTNSFSVNGGTIRGEDGVQRLATGTGATFDVGASGATVQATWSGKDVYIDGLMTGSGALTLSHGTTGGQTTAIHITNNSNTYSGTVTINNVGNGLSLNLDALNGLQFATLNLTAGQMVFGPTGTTILAGLTGSAGTIKPGGAGAFTLNVNNAVSNTYSGVLNDNTGTLALTKTNVGTLILSGTNTNTGATTISAGTLQIGAGSTTGTLGSGNIVDNATLFLNRSDGITLSNVISGTGAVTISNAVSSTPAFTPTTANTFSGGVTLLNNATTGTRLTISAAVTTVGSPGAITSSPFGTGAITIGQAATDKAGIWFVTANNITVANAITFNTALGNDRVGIRVDSTGNVLSGVITSNLAPATFSTQGTGSISLTGQVTGPQGLVLDGSPASGTGTLTVTLNNAGTANNYVGDTVINQNATVGHVVTLTLGANNQIPNGASAGNVTINTNGTGIGTLNLAGFSETINGLSGSGTVDGSSGTPTLTVGDNNATSTFSGIIQNTGGTLALTKIGAGTLTLSGANTHTGITLYNAGTLLVGNALALQNSTVDTSGAGALSFGTQTAATFGALQGSNNLSLQNTTPAAVSLTVGGNNASTTYSGVLTDTGTLLKAGTGTMILTGNNTLTGGVAVIGGVLSVSHVADSGTSNIGIAGGAGNYLAIKNATFQYTGAGSDTSTRFLWIDQGTGTFDITQATGSLTLNPTGGTRSFSITKAGPGSLTLGGAISSTAAVTVSAGTLALTAVNTYTGTTTITAGTLQITGAGSLGSGSYAGAIADNGSLIYNSSAVQTLSGVISGTGSLIQNGAGTLTLTNGNSFTGGLTVNAGTIIAAGPNGSPSSLGSGNVIVNNGGTIATGGANDNSLLVGAPSATKTITINTGGLVTDSLGRTNHLTALVMNGGTLSETGAANATYGNWNFDFGVSTPGNGTTSAITGGNAVLTQTGGTIFNIGTGDTLNVSNLLAHLAVMGDTGLIKQGAGTLVLTAANTYTSATTISAGTLQIGGGGTTGSLATASAITDNGSLIFNRTNTITQGTDFSGAAITGTGSLTQAGSGLVILTANNTYSGTTTISAGFLQIGNGGTTGAIASTNIVNNGTLSYYRTDTTTFSGTMTGTGTLQVAKGGTLTLASGANVTVGALLTGDGGVAAMGAGTYIVQSGASVSVTGAFLMGNQASQAGTFNQTGGTVTLSTTTADNIRIGHWPTETSVYNLSGGTWNATGTDTTLSWDGNGTIAISGGVANLRGVKFNSNLNAAHTGSGTLTLSGTGTLNIGAGGIYDGSTGANPIAINLSGGTLGSLAAWSSSLAMTATNTTTIDTTGGDIGLSGVVSSTGAITKAGTGTLTLSGANTYSGITLYNAGTLLVGSTLALQGSTVDTSGAGALSFGTQTAATFGGLQGSNNLSLQNTTPAAVALSVGANNTNTTYAGALTDTGSLTKVGTGTTTLTGNSTYAGNTTVSAGTLQIGSGGTTGSLPATTAITDNANLAFNRSDTYGGNVALVISGTGTVTHAGSGTLTLSATNSYSGGTVINAGIVTAAALANTGTNSTLGTGGFSFGGGTLQYTGGNVTINRAFTFNTGGGTVDITTGATTLNDNNASAFTGTGSLTKIGAGTLLISNGITAVGGGLFVNNGMVAVDASSRWEGSNITINSGGTFQARSGGGDAIGNSRSIFVNSGGAFDFQQVSTETITGLSLNGTGVGGTGALTNSAATAAFLTATGGVTLTGNTTFGGAGSITLTGAVGGNFNITKVGAGTIQFNTAATYGGSTTINAGILKVGGPVNTLPTTTAVSMTGGTLDLSNTNQTVASITGAAGTVAIGTATFSVGDASSTQFDGVFTASAAGILRKIGAGTLTLNGANTTLAKLTIDAGIVKPIGSQVGNRLANNAAVTINNTGIFELSIVNSLPTGASSVDLTINSGGTFKTDGGTGFHAHIRNITLTGGTISGLGTGNYNGEDFQLNGTITASGSAASTININNGISLNGSRTFNIADVTGNSSADLTISGAGDLQNTDTATGSLIKTGLGTLLLTNINTYTGTTSVQDGKLAVNGKLAAASAVTVGNASTTSLTPTLGGGIGAANGGSLIAGAIYQPSTTVGYAQGSVTVLGPGVSGSAGHVAPGNSVGTLSVGTLALNTGAILDYEFNGSANDFTDVTGGAGSLNIGAGVGVIGFNLYNENTQSAFSTNGTYHLIGYRSSFTGSLGDLAVLNPVANKTYVFSTGTVNGNPDIELSIKSTYLPSITLSAGSNTQIFAGASTTLSGNVSNDAAAGSIYNASTPTSTGTNTISSIVIPDPNVAPGDSNAYTGSITAVGATVGSTLNFSTHVTNGSVAADSNAINLLVVAHGTPTKSADATFTGHYLRNAQNVTETQNVTISNGTFGSPVANAQGIAWTAGATSSAALTSNAAAGNAISGAGTVYSYGLNTATNTTGGSQTFAFTDNAANTIGGGSLGNVVVNIAATIGLTDARSTNSNSADPGNYGTALTALVHNGQSYTGLESTVNATTDGSSGGATMLMSTATILAGTNNVGGQDRTATMAWRSRNTDESALLVSDVVNLTGLDGTIFVLQMTYDPNAAMANVMSEESLFLGYLRADGQWVHATDGNSGTSVNAGNFHGSWATFFAQSGHGVLANDLGAYGIDSEHHLVWAVLDHNSQFAVIPEPLALPGGLMLLSIVGVISRRRRA